MPGRRHRPAVASALRVLESPRRRVAEPEKLLEQGGLALLTAIVFAESGLFFGFFLPGDSLLFIAGFLSSSAGGNRLPPLPS